MRKARILPSISPGLSTSLTLAIPAQRISSSSYRRLVMSSRFVIPAEDPRAEHFESHPGW